jgi:hypothetical protein
MSFLQKIALAINLNQPNLEVFETLRKMDFLIGKEIHLVNINLTTTYALGLGEASIVYPLMTEQKQIHDSTIKELKRLAPEILPENFKGKLEVDCLFSDDPKRKFCHYVEENGLDTVIIAAREKKGFFESSFTQYVTKHTKVNVIVLKQHHGTSQS